MDIRIRINCDNAAFDGRDLGAEVDRILKNFVMALGTAANADNARELDGFKLRDVNGNTVGSVEVAE